MKAERVRMLALTIFVLRVYLFRIIVKPWIDFPDIKKKESLMNNCYHVCSLIYYILVDYIKTKCFRIGSNQVHLSLDNKNNPRDLGPLVLDRYELPDDPEKLR